MRTKNFVFNPDDCYHCYLNTVGRFMLKVEIKGLKEFQQKLDAISKGIERTAKNLNNTVVTQSVVSDGEGFVDRECPECLYFFKVHESNYPQIEIYNCPNCGHKADKKSWFVTDQMNSLRNQAREYAASLVQDALHGRKRPASSFDMIREDGKTLVRFPAVVRDILEQKRVCSKCKCTYAVIGAAYFCPACGYNAIDEYFTQSMNKIESSLQALLKIAGQLDRDSYKNFEQTIIENGLEDCATAFQKYVSELYNSYNPEKKLSPNDFQRIENGSQQWEKLSGKGYGNYLSDAELKKLTLYFQQRHLLAHHDGFIDEQYIERGGDFRYQIGQRIVIKSEDVSSFAAIVKKLVMGLQGNSA
jgi:predicted RNA-binding Zn-ribbon protein involved in translation (DUF1610 family)